MQPDLPSADHTEPVPGELWRHFKGGTYRVVAVATEEDTGRALVVYESVADGTTWARALGRWMGWVTTTGLDTIRRFSRVPAEGIDAKAPAVAQDATEEERVPGPTPQPPDAVQA